MKTTIEIDVTEAQEVLAKHFTERHPDKAETSVVIVNQTPSLRPPPFLEAVNVVRSYSDYRRTQKINAIKGLREFSQVGGYPVMGLAEAKAFVEAIA